VALRGAARHWAAHFFSPTVLSALPAKSSTSRRNHLRKLRNRFFIASHEKLHVHTDSCCCVLLCCSFCCGFTCGQTRSAPVKARANAAQKPVIQPPDVAAPKMGTNQLPNPGFLKQHEAFVKIAKEGTAELVFLGDSITAGWNGQKEIWNKAFGAYKPVNFGIGGDRTQHVLWRLENGEFDGIKPKAAVIMIGTNNSGQDSAEGRRSARVGFVHRSWPNTHYTWIKVCRAWAQGLPTKEPSSFCSWAAGCPLHRAPLETRRCPCTCPWAER
jgi:hypothetical protein